MSKSKKDKIDPFDLQFKKMVTSIMEEEFFKKDEVKDLTNNILFEIDKIISKHVKNHIVELCQHTINNIKSNKKEEKDA